MDPILYWNGVALEADRVSHTDLKDIGTLGPSLSTRALAIVHLAMYDAYAAVIDKPAELPRYLNKPGLPVPMPGASPDAAVAAAAHATLSALYPSQKAFFDLKHAQAGLKEPGLKAGHDFGLIIAQCMLDDRKDDPNASDDGYAASVARGAHRRDPDNPAQVFYAPYYGAKSKCFAVTKRHELAAPPFDTPEYLKALREVRGKGIAPELMGTLPTSLPRRKVDETLIGVYWAYDGASGLGTPPRLYNQIIREIAIAKGNSVDQNAQLFALVNSAMADAGILAWDQKYIHDFWRPVVGIREHDKSMGPAASEAANDISDDCDPAWLPFGAPKTNVLAKNFTPNFPAYPSGHATFGAAALHMTRLFYKEGGLFSANTLSPDTLFDHLFYVSDELNGVNTDNKGAVRPRHVRNFPKGLWQMIEENGRSRVFLGVHWVFDAFAVKDNGAPDLLKKVDGKFIGGVPLGLQIAEDIFEAGGGKAPKKSSVPPRS
jgi:hypothetical protein